jgi:hypothetical protein
VTTSVCVFFKLEKSFADKMLSGDEMGENAYVIKRIFFIIQLDDYFLEYFIRLLKRLRDINFEDVQKQKNLII